MRTSEIHAALRSYDSENGIRDYYTGAILRLADELAEYDEYVNRLANYNENRILIEIYEELEERINGKADPMGY